MKTLKEIEIYAKDNYVPIIREANIDYLEKIIKENKLYRILELGTAIGYSAIRMALISKDVHITTVERDKDMYLLAKENISDFDLKNQIEVINDDIFNFSTSEKYDLIFIDAAKAQYIKFFEMFKNNLVENGYIVSDNLELLDLQRLTSSKRSKRLVEKMKEYRRYLESLVDYKTDFLDIGDGFAITKHV